MKNLLITRLLSCCSLLLLLLLLGSNNVFAQMVRVVITVEGGPISSGCTNSGDNTVTVVLKNSSGGTLATYTSGTVPYYGTHTEKKGTYSQTLANGWTGKVSATGKFTNPSCSNRSATIGDQSIAFDGVNGGCNHYSFQSSVAVYDLTITVDIYADIGSIANPGTAYQTCGNTQVTLNLGGTQFSGTKFDWEITQDPSAFKPLKSGTGTSVNVNLANLAPTVGKYAVWYVRVKGTNCPTYRKSNYITLSFNKPAPTFSVTRTDPDCHNASTGSLKVDINKFDDKDQYTVTYYKPGAAQSTVGVVPLDSNVFTSTKNGLNYGSYDVEVVHAHDAGCKTKQTGKILNNPAALSAVLRASKYNNFQIQCNGDANGSLGVYKSSSSTVVGATGGTPPYKYAWSNGSSTTSITSLKAGTYSVTITDFKGCPALTLSSTLSQPSKPTVSLTSSGGTMAAALVADRYDISCASIKDAILTAIPHSDVIPATFTYAWSGTGVTDTTASVSGLGSGTYKVTIKDGNSCPASGTKTLTIRPDIDFTLQRKQKISCSNGTNGAVELKIGSVKNATGPLAYKWSSGESAVTEITGKSAGTYTLTITDNQSCKTSKNVTLTDPAGYSIAINTLSDFNGAKMKCHGDNSGKLEAVVYDTLGNVTTAFTNMKWTQNGTDYATTPIVDNLIAATYKVSLNYGTNHCSVAKSRTLVEPSQVTVTVDTASNYNGANIKCFGDPNGALVATGNNGTGTTYTYKWSTGETTAKITGKKAGTYSVIAYDINNCQSVSTSKTLIDPPVLKPSVKINSNYNGADVSCVGSHDGKLQASATGGTGTYSYAWINSSVTAPDLIGVGAATYTVTVTDKNNCSKSASNTIKNPSSVTASIKLNSDYHGKAISCYNSSDGILEAVGGGGVGGFTYSWDDGKATKINSGLAKGIHSVTIKDANLCASTLTSYQIIAPDTVKPTISITSDFNGVPIRCYNSSDGSLEASATGGAGSYSYAWSTGDTGSELIGAAEGTYSVTATDINNCPAVNSIFIDAPEPVIASIDLVSNYHGFNVKCKNSTEGFVEASGSGGVGGYSFSWLDTPERSFRIENIGEGQYRVEVKDQNYCADTATVVLNAPTQVTLQTQSRQAALCAGSSDGAITIEASGGVGGYEYRIVNDTWGSLGDFTGLVAGDHTFEARDVNNCVATITESIDEPEPINVLFDQIQPSYCAEPRGKAHGAVTGGTPSYTYEWRNNQNAIISTTDAIEKVMAGSYHLIIVDAHNCTGNNFVAISTTEGPEVSIEETILPKCNASSDGSMKLSASGNAPFQYSWPDGQTGELANNLAKGMYHVSVTDTYGCITVEEVSLSAPEIVSIDHFEKTMPSCNGYTDGKIKAFGKGGVGNFQYDWGTVALQEIANVGAGRYKVKVKDGNGCQSNISQVDLDQPTVLQLTQASKQLPSCNGYCDGIIEVSASGANGTYSFTWENGKTGASLKDFCAGNHTVVAKDLKGCTAQKTIQLAEPDAIKINLVKTVKTTCFGSCDGSLEVSAGGGDGGYTYSWSNGTIGAKNVNVCSGSHLVTVTDTKGCILKDQSFSISQPAAIDARIVQSLQPTCNGNCDGSLTVEAFGGNGAFSYKWFNETTESSLKQLCAGDYSITITDGKNCQLKDKSFTLTQPEIVNLTVTEIKSPTCNNGCDGSIAVIASGGDGTYKYEWSSGSVTARANALCAAQQYSVKVFDTKECSATASYVVGNPPALNVDLGGSIVLCEGQKYELSPGASWTKFSWRSNVGVTSDASSLVINKAGLYWVDVQNADGCTAQDTFLLETSNDLLKASLLMVSEAQVADTVVFIDISWPLPDQITWEYPEEMTTLLNNGDVVYGQFYVPGIYDVKLNVALGECRDSMTKKITILERSVDDIDGRLGFEQFVKKFDVYSNPSDGHFDVIVELAEESDITLSAWSLISSHNLGLLKHNGNSSYVIHVDFRPLSSGPYILRLDHARGYELIRFIVE